MNTFGITAIGVCKTITMTDGTGETIAQYGAWLTDEVIWYDIMPSSSFITNIIVWRLHLPKSIFF